MANNSCSCLGSLGKTDFCEWVHEPFDFKKEKCRLLVISLIVLSILAMAVLSYYQGSLYGETYRIVFTGIVSTIGGGILLVNVAIYLAKAILGGCGQQRPQTIRKPKSLNPEKVEKAKKLEEQIALANAKALETYKRYFDKIFHGLKMEDLPVLDQPNLKGNTGCFDQLTALDNYMKQNNLNLLQGQQSERPFKALRVAVKGQKDPVLLMIAPHSDGTTWFVRSKGFMGANHKNQLLYICENLSTGKVDHFFDWLTDIVNGKKRHIFFDNDLKENTAGSKVSLWRY